MNTKVRYIVAASAIAMGLLILIQVKWMQQSQALIEEQFDQKVNMAYCMALEAYSDSTHQCAIQNTCLQPGTKPSECLDQFSEHLNADFKKEFTIALAYYDIHLPFKLTAKPAKPSQPWACLDTSYSCSLGPVAGADNQEIDIYFPGKRAYINEKLGFMSLLSIVIILVILSIFAYSSYHLYKQKQISRRNKDFFNHMAHEFKTPLTNIGLATKRLLKTVDNPYLTIIKDENSLLTEQVSRVLTMASLEAGQHELRKERFDVSLLIQEIMNKLAMQLKEKGAKIYFDKLGNNFEILADRFHISNAIRNIIDNALKYNTEAPEIQILLHQLENKLSIQISDNGIGIGKNEQNVIFEKFYRVRQGDLYQNKGFGLGLSYVKKIVELHNGEIKIFSELNKGTTFDLLIPNMITV